MPTFSLLNFLLPIKRVRVPLQFDEKLQRIPAVSSEPSDPPGAQALGFLYSNDNRAGLHGDRPACPANGQAILDYFGRAPAERFFRLFGKLSPSLQAQSQDLEKCKLKETRHRVKVPCRKRKSLRVG